MGSDLHCEEELSLLEHQLWLDWRLAVPATHLSLCKQMLHSLLAGRMETAESRNRLLTIALVLSSNQPALQPLILYLTHAWHVFWGPLSTGFLWPCFGSRRTIPHPPPPHTIGGEEIENSEVKPRKKRRWGVFVKFSFYFSLCYPNFVGIKVISLSWLCFALDGNWWVISLCLYPSPRSLLIYFISPV